MARFITCDKGIGELTSDGGVRLLRTELTSIDDALRAGLDLHLLQKLPTANSVSQESVRFLPPVVRPSKIWAQGVAYRDHAHEVGADPSATPRVFLIAPSALIGHNANIRIPAHAPDKVDFEGEVAVVIGPRPASSVEVETAWEYVAGLTCCNDVSARDIQLGGAEGWANPRVASPTIGKSLDTFKPLGPCVATLDEVAHRDDVGLKTVVDGEVRQAARTSDLLFSIAELVSYLSRLSTLLPGDVIATGTPGGVGLSDGRFLKAGSHVSVEVEGVGVLTNTVIR